MTRSSKISSKIKPRKPTVHLVEQINTSAPDDTSYAKNIAAILIKQINDEELRNKYMPAKIILAFVGVGAFIGASFVFPSLPIVLKPFLTKKNHIDSWKHFNVSYVQRTLKRLEEQKLIKIIRNNDKQTISVTAIGEKKLLKYALDELTITKPKYWDRTWRLVSYDIPKEFKRLRDVFQEYLRAWGFYPLHESVYLHAYPCEKEIISLREYLGITKYVRIFAVSRIENDDLFREFFGV